MRVAEEARRSAELDAESAEESRRSLETLVTDLKGLLLSPSDGRDLSASTSASGDDCVYARDTKGGDQGGGSGGERGRVNHSSDAASRPSLLTSVPVSLGPMKMNPGSNAAARSNAARRIVSLSEELRVSKLKASGLRRQVEGLREDRRHLERKLEVAEVATRALEEAKAEAETRALLSEHVDGADGGGGNESRKRLGVDAGGNDIGDIGNNGSGRIDLDVDGGSPGAAVSAGRRLGTDWLSVEEQQLLGAAAVPAEIDFLGLNPEEALRRLKGAHTKVRCFAPVSLGGVCWSGFLCVCPRSPLNVVRCGCSSTPLFVLWHTRYIAVAGPPDVELTYYYYVRLTNDDDALCQSCLESCSDHRRGVMYYGGPYGVFARQAVSVTRALEVMKAERDGALVKAEDALRRTRDLQRELR